MASKPEPSSDRVDALERRVADLERTVRRLSAANDDASDSDDDASVEPPLDIDPVDRWIDANFDRYIELAGQHLAISDDGELVAHSADLVALHDEMVKRDLLDRVTFMKAPS